MGVEAGGGEQVECCVTLSSRSRRNKAAPLELQLVRCGGSNCCAVAPMPDSVVRTSALTKCTQLFLATCLLFLDGSFFSITVFTVPTESASPVPGALEDAWSMGMVLMGLVSIPTSILAGKYLNDGQVPSVREPALFGRSKTARIRIIGILSAIPIFLLLVAAWGVSVGNAAVVILVVSLLGNPFNLYFLLPIEILAEWMPARPGLAIGCGQTAFGLGTMYFSGLFELFIDRFGCIRAVCVVATLLGALATFISFLLKWPPREYTSAFRAPTDNLEPMPSANAISVAHFLQLRSFWLCVLSIMTTQVGYAFIAYFFQLGLTFGQDMHSLVRLFEAISLLTAFARPLLGMMVDRLKWGEGLFSMGSRNMLTLAMGIQAVTLFTLIPVSNMRYFPGFAVGAAVLLLVVAAGECVAGVLMRDVFGSENSSLMLGAGASIGFGVGAFIPTVILQLTTFAGAGMETRPSTFNLFYLMSMLWSVVGLWSTISISTRETPDGGVNVDINNKTKTGGMVVDSGACAERGRRYGGCMGEKSENLGLLLRSLQAEGYGTGAKVEGGV
eukprot:GFKZ01008321.1.p1 GENE.GFKZ01008321.1~~GFKZ01008321.1.p1  ORF type:complete len:557 (+),score=27.74 GFKZ01008321.1:135-1805(+)